MGWTGSAENGSPAVAGRDRVRTTRVTVSNADISTKAVPPSESSTRSGTPSDSSSRLVSHAAETPLASRSPAVVACPLVSRRRTVTSACSPGASAALRTRAVASAPVRPEASGLPRGFTALTVTLAGVTDSRLAPGAACGPATTATRSWLYSPAAGLNHAARQSPWPEARAYSNVWLQCCQAKLLPSGAVRRSPSIHTPDGHALQERISEMFSVPSGVTRLLGVPRLSSATE